MVTYDYLHREKLYRRPLVDNNPMPEHDNRATRPKNCVEQRIV